MTRRLLSTALAVSLVALSLALSPAQPATAAVPQVYLPNVTKTLGGPGGWTTPIVVQNTGSVATDVTLTFYRFNDGRLAGAVSRPGLKPGQSWSFDPRSSTALPNDTQFSTVVSSTTGEVAATVIQGTGSSWMAYAGTTTGGATVYLPNITRNLGGPAGWNTPFIVQNLGAATTTATISFYNFSDGQLAKRIENVKLEPGRSQAFLTWAIDGLADDRQYAVVVQGPAGSQLYAVVNQSSENMAMSYEGLLGGAEVVYLPNVLKYLGGTDRWYTPFIVQNVGTTGASFALEFYSFDTGQLVRSVPGQFLQPGRSLPVDVRFSPAGLPAGSYSVVIRGQKGAQLGAVVNEVDPGAGMAMSYNGTGQTQAQQSVYLPLLQRNVGSSRWFSPIIAQNVGASPTDITLTLFDANGAVAVQKTFPAIKPGAAAVYDPRFDRRLKDGTYSGLLQANGAITAVVNLSGAINGDYAMAITGVPGPATAIPAVTTAAKNVGPHAFTLKVASNADVWVENTIAPADAAKIVAQTDADATQIQTDYGRQFSVLPVIYVFATTASFTQGLQSLLGYTPDRAKLVAGGTAALFSPAAQLTLANWEELKEYQPQSAIRHELTHSMHSQIIRTNPTMPAWLDEGLAVREELTMPGSKYVAMQVRYGTASMAATNTLMPLSSLDSPTLWSARRGTAGFYQYLEATQAVLFLREDIGQAGIVRILELMGQGRTFGDAYAIVAGKPFSEFAAAFPARAKALAPSSPGVVAVEDSPIGPGLSFMAYGFAPLSLVTVSVRSSTHEAVVTGLTTQFGTRFLYLPDSWADGTYNITVTSATSVVSVVARKI